MSAICGGVISITMHKKNVKAHGIWADTMSYILPDDKYKLFLKFKKQGKEKEANKIFNKFAVSQI
jgi:hypothetical protein